MSEIKVDLKSLRKRHHEVEKALNGLNIYDPIDELNNFGGAVIDNYKLQVLKFNNSYALRIFKKDKASWHSVVDLFPHDFTDLSFIENLKIPVKIVKLILKYLESHPITLSTKVPELYIKPQSQTIAIVQAVRCPELNHLVEVRECLKCSNFIESSDSTIKCRRLFTNIVRK